MRLWILLLCVGVIGGHLTDGCPAPPIVERAGRRVLQADLHVHTRLSDGFLSPFEVVIAARRAGLDAIAITEHNALFPARVAHWFSGLIGGPIVIVGEEVTTRDYHLLVYGITRTIAPRRDLGAVLREVHAQGGLAVAAHPTKHYWPALEAALPDLDGIEVLHPAAYGDSEAFSWSDMVAFYERASDAGQHKTAIGTSDYHFYKLLGLGRTLLFVEDPSAEGALEALRAGATVVEAPDGRRFGDPALIAALESAPLPATDSTTGYRPSGAVDLISRCLGWLGLMGLMLLRSRKERRSADS